MPAFNRSGFDLGLESSGQTLRFHDHKTSPIGIFRFLAEESDPQDRRSFTIWVGPKMRNVLVRKALLERLGYKVPSVQYVKDLTVTFRGQASLSKENEVW